MLRQAAYVATHHDAVTGTEKTAVRVMSPRVRACVRSTKRLAPPQVAVDYTVRLDMGNKAVDSFISTVMQSLDGNSAEPAAAARTAVKLFNPLGWTRKEVLRIPVNSANVKVVDSAGRTVISQVNPVPAYSLDRGTHFVQRCTTSHSVFSALTASCRVVRCGAGVVQAESAAYNLFFVVELRPLEIQTFYIQASQFAGEEGQAHLGTLAAGAVTSIENEYLRVYLDPQTNRYAPQRRQLFLIPAD